jgi:hypothetical protein
MEKIMYYISIPVNPEEQCITAVEDTAIFANIIILKDETTIKFSATDINRLKQMCSELSISDDGIIHS